MPTYTYDCLKCGSKFELFFYIKDYKEQPACDNCGSKSTNRSYVSDVLTQSASVKKADSELKTIGDLARRNSDRMSEDQKISLHQKHNSYREEDVKSLPSGMSRMKKPPKPLWPGSDGRKQRRKPKK